MKARTPGIVEDTCETLPRPVTDEFRSRATELAERAELQHPINNAPTTIAIAAIYLTGIEVDSRFSQQEIADAAGASAGSLRSCYPDIAAAEDLTLKHRKGYPTEVER